MSFFDDASLVTIPSGVKDGVLYSVKPIDGSGDLTFSRGSDIEATRVAANGYIEKAKVNLVTYSEQFDNVVYGKANCTITANQIANPLTGSITADLFTASGAITETSLRVLNVIQTNTVQTISVYVKYDNYQYFYIRQIATNKHATFDIQNGTISYQPNDASQIEIGIESLGGGWYRLFYAFNASSMTNNIIDIGLSATSTTFSGSVAAGSKAYLYGFQLNYGLLTQEYQETTTTSVITGITNDMPRLDYSGGATCPSLLLEPSRSNILPQSEFFGAGDWVKINTSVTTNATTSPEGVVNASSLTEDTSSGFHVMYDNIVAAFSTAHTLSAFVKPNVRSIIYLRMENASTGGGLGITYFNVSTGQILTDSSTSSSIEAYANGWYRVSITATTPAAQSTLFAIGLADADNSRSYTGDGTSGIYLYGAQAEPSASYPSSMIPTYGTSATRTSESCSRTGVSSLIGQTEGTIYWEGSITGIPVDQTIFGVEKESSNFVIRFGGDGTNIYAQSYNGSTSLFFETTTPSIGQTIKLAFAYKAGSYAFYKNGTLVAAGTNATTIPTCDKLQTNVLWSTSGGIGAYNTNQALLFKTRLTNAQLAELTA